MFVLKGEIFVYFNILIIYYSLAFSFLDIISLIGAFSICMCFLKLQRVELSRPVYALYYFVNLSQCVN